MARHSGWTPWAEVTACERTPQLDSFVKIDTVDGV